MAAGSFKWYNTGVKYIMQQKIDLEAGTIVAMPIHHGYTPLTASHSALAQITAYQSTASGTVVNAITLAGKVLTGSGAAQVKWDFDNITGFSAGGATFSCKYVAFYAQSASSGGVDNLLIGWLDVDTSATTGVEGTQVNVTVPAGGMGEFNTNP